MIALAILVYARKLTETSEQITYEFGGDPDAFTRVMTINKATRECHVEDGVDNMLFRKAAGAVFRRLRETGEWPNKAMYAA